MFPGVSVYLVAALRRVASPGTASFVAFMGVAVAFLMVWVVPGTTFDFAYDWLAAKAFLGGVNPYQTIGSLADAFGLVNSLEWIYPRPPGALVLLAPVGVVPYSMEYIVGRILTVLSAVALAVVFSRLAGFRIRAVLVLLPVVLLLPPASLVLLRSQTDFLIAALIGVTFLLARRSDRFPAGIPLGLAVVLKLWAWPVALALILGRRWRAGLGAAIAFGVLNAVGLAFGHVSLEAARAALVDAWQSHGTRSASLTTALGLSPLVLPSLVLVGMCIWAIGRRSWSWESWYILSVPIALMAAPIVWVTYTVSLLIPIGWILGNRKARSRRDGNVRSPAPPGPGGTRPHIWRLKVRADGFLGRR